MEIAIAFSGHYNDLTFVSENFEDAKRLCGFMAMKHHITILHRIFLHYTKNKNLVCLSEKNDDKSEEFNEKNEINKALIYNPINLDEREIDEKIVKSLKQRYGDFILMVGRMAKDKDQATLIRALSYLKEKYSLKKNLVLVGDGSERESLEKLVQEKQLEKQVFFAGAHYDVQNYYMAASIYAFKPSRGTSHSSIGSDVLWAGCIDE